MSDRTYDDEELEIVREMASAISAILERRVRLEGMDLHLMSIEFAQAAYDVAEPRLAKRFTDRS